jgi:maltose-binding protein MalE
MIRITVWGDDATMIDAIVMDVMEAVEAEKDVEVAMVVDRSTSTKTKVRSVLPVVSLT